MSDHLAPTVKVSQTLGSEWIGLIVEQVIFHVIVNPDGEPKVTADFQNAECRG
jgi:hypothetical protein